MAFWFIFIYAIAAAIGALKIPTLTNFMANVQNYLPNVIAAVLILVIGVALAGAAGGLVDRLAGDTASGRMARAVGPALILAIVVFMVLNQLKIAPAIVTTTYIALIGMLAVAGALAFGLGGRELAAEMMRDAYGSSRDNRRTDRTTPRRASSGSANRPVPFPERVPQDIQPRHMPGRWLNEARPGILNSGSLADPEQSDRSIRNLPQGQTIGG